jgi:hypothetical protein
VPDNVWNAAYDKILADFASDDYVDVEYFVAGDPAGNPEYYVCAYSNISDAAICYSFADCEKMEEQYSTAVVGGFLVVGVLLSAGLIYTAMKAG